VAGGGLAGVFAVGDVPPQVSNIKASMGSAARRTYEPGFIDRASVGARVRTPERNSTDTDDEDADRRHAVALPLS
jgi:hypothetical protein